MKRLLGLIILLPFFVSAQFSDDFSDGNFSVNPSWIGDTSLFDVSIGGSLWLNAPAVSDEAHLSTPSQALDTASWEFTTTLEFNPSASNLARIYLVSDEENLEGALNGYFVEIGGTLDEVSLYRQDGLTRFKIIDGTDDLVDTDPVVVRVRVERTTNGGWSLFADTAPFDNYVLQGTVIDNTYTSSAFFGVRCIYTSTRSDKFFFDDFVVNGAPYFDTIAPELAAISVVSNASIQLRFNEAIDSAVAVNPLHYSVDGGIGVPDEVVLSSTSPQDVLLTFTSSFAVANTYNLSYSGIEDLSGNIGSGTTPFAFLNERLPVFGELVINEILADPSPSVGLPEADFIELINVSDRYLLIDTLTVEDGAATTSLAIQKILAPNAFLIVTDDGDTASYAPFGESVGMPSFPNLNIDGDRVRVAVNGRTTDDLVYNKDWYADPSKENGGYSLERVNPYSTCSGDNNWRSSTATIGGTPGGINSVFSNLPDVVAPAIEEVRSLSLTRLVVYFNEPIDSLSAASGVFSVGDGIIISSVLLEAYNTQCTLDFASPIVQGSPYTLSVQGLEDCDGNTLDTSLLFGLGGTPKPFDLIITEILPIPSDEASSPPFEFVELMNRSDKVISTEGLFFRDRTFIDNLPSVTLYPGEYVLIADNDAVGELSVFAKVLEMSSFPTLNNTDDDLSLIYNDSVIDRVFYKDAWFSDERPGDEGFSLERINPNDLCGEARNWTSSADPTMATPGRENSVWEVTEAPELELTDAFFITPINLFVEFDQRAAELDSIYVSMNEMDWRGSTMDAGRFINITNFDQYVPGTLYEGSMDVSGCDGQVTPVSFEVYLPDSGDVVLNEVLFNPRGSGTDFIELFNNAEHPISLRNWSLGHYDADDSLELDVITTEKLTLEPGAYLALNEDNQDLLLNYPLSSDESFLECDLPSLPNDDGKALVVNPWREIIQAFDYDESYHFALIEDPDGVSLEKVRPDLEVNDPNSWHSASATDNYATPGYINSQFIDDSENGAAFTLSADIVSPDGDGYQDVVIIDYSLSSPGFSVSVEVYTDRGVLIRSIASNVIAGTQGQFVWDGLTDQGEKARTGIHIIIAEVFNLKNEKERFRLPIVVASKL